MEAKLDVTDKKLDVITEALKAFAKTKNVTIAPMFIRENNIELDEDEIAVSEAVSEALSMRKEQSIKTMTLDTGCQPNLVSEDWLLKYLRENNMRKEKLKSISCNQKFRFGPRNTYTSKEKIVLPVTIRQLNGEFVKMDMEVYVIEAENIPFLCGSSTLEQWEGVLNLKTKVLNINVGEQREIQCHESKGGHVVIPLYPDFTKEEIVMLNEKEKENSDYVEFQQIKLRSSPNGVQEITEKFNQRSADLRKDEDDIYKNSNLFESEKSDRGVSSELYDIEITKPIFIEDDKDIDRGKRDTHFDEVPGGQNVKNVDSEMKVFVRRMFKRMNKIRWQKSRERGGNMIQSIIKLIS